MSKISGVDLGSIYSGLEFRLDNFETNITNALQGYFKLQTGVEKASSIMDKSVFTAVSNIEKSYKLWENANNSNSKSLEDNSKKIESYKESMGLLDVEIKKSEKTLESIEQQCGKNSKEYEAYKSHVLDLKLKHSELSQELQKLSKTTETLDDKLKKLDEGYQKTNTQIMNLEKSYKIFDLTQEKTGKGIFDNSEKVNMLKSKMTLLDDELKKHETLLKDVEKEYGKDSKEAEQYKGKILDLKLAHAELGGELKKVGKETTTLSGKFKLLGAEFSKIDEKYSTFNTVGDKLQGIGNKLTMGVTLPVIGATTAAGKFAMDFESGAAKVSTIADTTKMSMDELKRGVVNLSNEAGLSTKDLNEGLYETLSAGVDTAKSVDFLGVAVKAAKGGFTDTATAVDGLTTTLNSYGLEADKATDISNQMLICQNLGKTTFGELASSVGKVTPIAASLGITTNELFSSLASTTAQGLATSESVTALKAAMSNIIKPSKEAKEISDSLGISFNVSSLQSKGWIGFLKDVKEGLKNASPEFANLSTKFEENSRKLLQLEQSGQKGSKAYKELAKQNKGLNKELELLAQASDSTIGGFATLFGSVEGLNSILMLTSDNGMNLYNESMKQMKENTGALDDAYNKMAETTETKFAKALNKGKNSLMELGVKALPLFEKGIDSLSGLIDKFNNLSPATQEWVLKIGLASAALGPFLSLTGGAIKGVGGLVKLAPKVKTLWGAFSGASTAANVVSKVGTVASAASGASGIGALSGALGALGSVALPVVGIVAAVGAGIYVAHKNNQYLAESCIKSTEELGFFESTLGSMNGHIMHSNEQLEEMNVKHKQWSKDVSPESQKALDEIAKKIADYNLEVKGAEKLDNLVDSTTGVKLNTKLDQICNSAINKIKSRSPEIQKTMAEAFNADGQLDKNEKTLMEFFSKSQDEQIVKVNELKNKIVEIYKKQKDEHRELKENELKEIETLTQEMGRIEMQNTVKSKQELLAAQADFNVRMKNLDINGVSELLSEKAKAREDETQKIKDHYDKQIEMLRLSEADMNEEQKKAAKEEIDKLETKKNEAITKENEKYKGFLESAIEKYPQLINYINMQNGELLTKQEQQKQLELNKYSEKMEGMLSITKTGYYQIKDKTTGQMHECYVEVNETTGQISGAWDKTTQTIYGNPIKAKEDIDKDLKDGKAFEPIATSYNTKKEEIWENAIEVQCKKDFGLFDWIKGAWNSTVEWFKGQKGGIFSQANPIGLNTFAPQFNATGTDFFSGGLTWVNEDGKELIELPEGAQLTNLPRGTKIFNASDSANMKNRMLQSSNKVDELERKSLQVDKESNLTNEVDNALTSNKDINKFISEKTSDLKKVVDAEVKVLKDSLYNLQQEEEKALREARGKGNQSLRDSIKDTYEAKKKAVRDEIELKKKHSEEEIEEIKRLGNLSKEQLAAEKQELKERQEMLKKELEARKLFTKSVNDLNNNIVNALKEKYTEECKIKEEAIQKQITDLDKLKESELKDLEETYTTEKDYLDSKAKDEEENIRDEMDRWSKWKDNAVKNIERTYDFKKRATEDSQRRSEKAFEAESDRLDKWKERQLDGIEEVSSAKIKSLQDEIDRLEQTDKQVDRAEKDKEELAKINSLKEQLPFEHNDFNKAELQKEIARLEAERTKRLNKEAIDDKKENLKKQIDSIKEDANKQKESIKTLYDHRKEDLKKRIEDTKEHYRLKKQQLDDSKKYELESINDMYKRNKEMLDRKLKDSKSYYESEKKSLEKNYKENKADLEARYKANKENLENELKDVKKFYEDRTKEANLQAEAEKLIMNNNQKEIVALLASYGKEYKAVGQSLGERLLDGFKPAIEDIKGLMDSVNAEISHARNNALRAMKDLEKLNQASSNSGYGSSTHNEYNVNIVSPVAQTPSQQRRETETMLRRLSYSS